MIIVDHLTKKFGRTVAVNDVTFDIPDSKVFCLLGPNGSGKTTTLKMLAGLIKPTYGRISVDGWNLQHDSLEARRGISYLPQRALFPDTLTAKEILTLFAKIRGLSLGVVEAALSDNGLDKVASRPVGQFSGGMAQRLGLALTAMPDSPILLLDEPTASLDPEGVVHFREFVAGQKLLGKTIVFSTHLLSEAEKLADLVAIYLGGRLITLQAVDELSSEVARFQTMEEFYLHFVTGGGR